MLNIINSFQHWEQLSEISADRVGLFVVDDNKNAVTSLIKLTHGLSDNIIKIDYEEVMKEIDNIFSENRYFHIDSSQIIVNNFPERKEILFSMLVDVALADGEYTESEHNLLFDLGKKLQMTNQEISNIILKLITNKFLPKKM